MSRVISFQQSATHAILKTDGIQIGEHTISVAISNPPGRKTPQVSEMNHRLYPLLVAGKRTLQGNELSFSVT